MLQILTHNILPVFSVLALGFVLGRAALVSAIEATAINRVAFLVLQPALVLPLIAGLDLSNVRFDALGLYALCEALMLATAYLTARRLFGRDPLEAWLLGMAVVFVNSLLYVLPISILIYGEAMAPMTGVVALDASFWFAFFIVTTGLIAGRGGGAAPALRRITTNPVLIAILLGVIALVVEIPLPAPALTAMKFAGAAAAPMTLLALGVILSGHAIRPTPTIIGISALKLAVFPLLVGAVFTFHAVPETWAALLTLNAAGPSGAMAFSLALLHGVRTDAIAPVIIWTSLLSLVSLSLLA